MVRRVEFRDQAQADAWVLQNKLRRTKLPTGQRGVFYLTDVDGNIVGEWQQITALERSVIGTSVVEIAWFDERRVNLPREMVN